MFYCKTAGKDIPMLSVIDDGCGMNHVDIQRMISFGHGKTEVDDPNHIGRYGIGFKVLCNPALYHADVCLHNTNIQQKIDTVLFILPEIVMGPY